MNDKQRQFVEESFIEMYQSLLESVKQAGGDESSFYYNEIKNMTVAELINRLATNGIRFTNNIVKDRDEFSEIVANLLGSEPNVSEPKEEPQDKYFKIGNIIRLEFSEDYYKDYILSWTGNNDAYLIGFDGGVWSNEPMYTSRSTVTMKVFEDFMLSPKRFSRPINFYKIADNAEEYFEKQRTDMNLSMIKDLNCS
jgi:hypothetical protein